MKILYSFSLAALLALLPPPTAGAQSAAPSVPSEPRSFAIEVEIPAPVSEVWKAFSTSEGLSTWLTPHATVDLRAGGEWTAHFPGGGTGGGTIVSFVPEKEIVLAAMAPPQFPHVRAERTTATFAFEPRDKVTIVRLTQTGWKSGQEWTHAYEYLLAGNAQLMATLHKRFAEGPIHWDSVFGAPATPAKAPAAP